MRRLSHQRSRIEGRTTGLLHEVSLCFPNRRIKRHKTPLQAALSTPQLKVIIFGRECVLSCVLWAFIF